MARLDSPTTHDSDWSDATLPSDHRPNGAFSAQILFEALDQGIPIVERMARHELDALIRSDPDWVNAILQRPISDAFRDFFYRRWQEIQATHPTTNDP